jgi:hypothetical protein
MSMLLPINTTTSSSSTTAPSSSSSSTAHHEVLQRRHRQETYRLQQLQQDQVASSSSTSSYCPSVVIDIAPQQAVQQGLTNKQSCRCTVTSLRRNGMRDYDYCLACLDSGVSCLVRDHVQSPGPQSQTLSQEFTVFHVSDKLDAFLIDNSFKIPYGMTMNRFLTENVYDRDDEESKRRRREQEYEDFCLQVYNMV